METQTFYFHPQLREQFKAGNLIDTWFVQYPQLFDPRDLEIAKNQRVYHFYEWLSAIMMFHTTGYLSLVEQYAYKNHPRKNQVLRELVSPNLLDFIANHSADYGYTQCPDLFVYKQNGSDWFFGEVKGPTDSISKGQARFFTALAEMSGKPIRLIKVQKIK